MCPTDSSRLEMSLLGDAVEKKFEYKRNHLGEGTSMNLKNINWEEMEMKEGASLVVQGLRFHLQCRKCGFAVQGTKRLSRWHSGKESACWRCKRGGFHPCIRKIPWRRKLQSIPVFVPRKFHGQRSLVGYSPWGLEELDTTEWLNNSKVQIWHMANSQVTSTQI